MNVHEIAQRLGITARRADTCEAARAVIRWEDLEPLLSKIEIIPGVGSDELHFHARVGKKASEIPEAELQTARGLVAEFLDLMDQSNPSRYKIDRIRDKMLFWFRKDIPAQTSDELLAEYYRHKGGWRGKYPDWWQRVQLWYKHKR